LRFRIFPPTVHEETGQNGSVPASELVASWRKDGYLQQFGRETETQGVPDFDLADLRLPEANANAVVLEDFIVSSIKQHPAKRCALILSGHGSGIVGRRPGHVGFAPGSIRTVDIRSILDNVKAATGRRIDLLGMDSCLMGMAEIAWELRRRVCWLVGSEGLTPETGWPFHRMLEYLQQRPTSTPSELALSLVKSFLRYYADYVCAGRSVDIAVSDLSGFKRLGEEIRDLATVLTHRIENSKLRDAIILAHWRAQAYKDDEYCDLWDFSDLLGEGCDDVDVVRHCERVKNSVAEVITKSVYSGPAYQHSHGLSIYFPWSEVSPVYSEFRFAQETNWLRFLRVYVEATRREMRGQPRFLAIDKTNSKRPSVNHVRGGES
jgi:hypothetical protein